MKQNTISKINIAHGFDYLGSLVYKRESNIVTGMESTSFGGGRINATTNTYDINYFITDHLGSTRVIVDNAGNIKEQNDYYPFGKEHANPNLINSNNRWKFTGMEFMEISDINMYDSQFRWYDPDIIITPTQDPHADRYPWQSPYSWCGGNPVNRIDPDGQEWVDAKGNKIEDHSNIQAYIFFDPKSFTFQTIDMYKDLVAKYGEGSVAISGVTTMAEFAQDWGDMASGDIQEVNLNYHGNNQTVFLNSSAGEYITATGDGKTNRSETKAKNVQNLPTPSGDISNAQLNINTCQSNNPKQYPLKGSEQTLMVAFRTTTDFNIIRGTSYGVSYSRITGQPFPGRTLSRGTWDYMKRPTPIPQKYQIISLSPK